MKKIIALLLAVLMLVSCIAMAEMPEKKYPDLDFGGETVYIYDWWSNGERQPEPDPDTALLYAYRDWVEETYNVKIVETSLSDWEGNPQELANMVMNGVNDKLCLIAVAADFQSTPLANDLYMPWQIDLTADKWNQPTISINSKNGEVYGVAVGPEPRNCFFFNKRVLEEAGIDWNTLYDAQADGTWNWDMLLDILSKVQRDIDNDGVIDIWGMTGSNDDLCVGLVFSNEAEFFTIDEEGKLAIAAGSQNALDAFAMFRTVCDNYMAPKPDGANWDWFKDYWEQGTTAFYAAQAWQGFNDGAEMADMEDEWGCVAVPMGPAASTYYNMACNNVYGVPNVYDEATALKIQQIYDVYTDPTPGIDEEFAWIGNKYNFTDDRAVDETFAMLREDEHIVANRTFMIGSTNDILGNCFLWSAIWNGTPAEAVETATPTWQAWVDVFNGVAE